MPYKKINYLTLSVFTLEITELVSILDNHNIITQYK